MTLTSDLDLAIAIHAPFEPYVSYCCGVALHAWAMTILLMPNFSAVCMNVIYIYIMFSTISHKHVFCQNLGSKAQMMILVTRTML